MNTFLKPKFRITINGGSASGVFITSLSLNDYEGENIDLLRLELAPNSKTPKFGDKIELFMGRDDYYFFGTFYVSVIKESYLRGYSIEATSLNYASSIKVKKNRTFDNLRIGDVLRLVARENGLKTRLDFEAMGSVEVVEQSDESDASLCDRLSKKYGCTFKIKNDTLIFIDQDKSFDRREYRLDVNDCQSLDLEYFANKEYKSVEVTYTDSANNQRSIIVGSGEPKFRSIQNFKSDTEALQWAQTRLKTLNNQKIQGSLSTVGGVFFAGAFLILKLRGKEHKFLIKTIEHTFSANEWTCRMTFE